MNQFDTNLHSEIFTKSWIMVNTATREALPNSFLETSAHECAILSHVDPDGFASNFGHHAADDDFQRGLAWLLEHGRWKERGRAAGAHVREVFEMNRALDLHEAAYSRLLTRSPRSVAAIPSYGH